MIATVAGWMFVVVTVIWLILFNCNCCYMLAVVMLLLSVFVATTITALLRYPEVIIAQESSEFTRK